MMIEVVLPQISVTLFDRDVRGIGVLTAQHFLFRVGRPLDRLTIECSIARVFLQDRLPTATERFLISCIVRNRQPFFNFSIILPLGAPLLSSILFTNLSIQPIQALMVARTLADISDVLKQTSTRSEPTLNFTKVRRTKASQSIPIHWLEIGELDVVCLKPQNTRGSFFPAKTRTTVLERVAGKLGTYQLPHVFLVNVEGDWHYVAGLLKTHYRLPPLKFGWSLVKFHTFGWGRPSGHRLEKGDLSMFNRRLFRQLTTFGPELHGPVVLSTIVEER
jgi:hypothetical protein